MTVPRYGRNVDDPLTGGTTGAEDMAVALLKYANRAKIADALTEQGYPVTRMTVNRWASGTEMPGIARRMVMALFGHEPDTTKAPPPEWAGAMESRIVSEVRVNRAALYRELAEQAATEALRRAGLLPEEPLDGTEDQPPASAGPTRGLPG